ncbi:AraC family transcriptional regulator [Sulfitobacter sp. S190]|uniref:AraC family transcriptional regulator n=1 Tax=Sulfitobacter sp. S190 TaxID=2867022 RepID=UPI0021A5B433|nr:AraC family transcriptional regulator [Sulfitobacter sp. S190]UWR24539.1 AraC family transcriptional regulator [Sulfitobacter sp. S190]
MDRPITSATDPMGQTRDLRPLGSAYYTVNADIPGSTVTDVAVAGDASVEFFEVIQTNELEDVDTTESEAEFVLGVTSGQTYGTLRVDAGEGRHEFDMSPQGAYLNHPRLHDQFIAVDGRAQIVLASIPYRVLADRLHIDEVTLENAMRPLHERLLTREPLVRPLVLSMWQAARTHHESSNIYVDQALDTVALHCLSLARGGSWGRKAFLDGDRSSVEEKLHGAGDTPNKARFKQTVEYIEDHLGQPLRLLDLAKHAGMSSSHFSRAFKAAMGEPAWAYVRRRRIEVARHLLESSSCSIAEIAFRTGFSSQAHLTKAFSDHFGMPPATFRAEVSTPLARRS